MMFFPKFNRKKVGIVAVASGLLCLMVAAVWLIYSYRLTSTAVRTTGHITQLVERHSDHGDSFSPVFTFTDRGSVPHIIYSNVGTYPPPNHVGDAVTVLYSPGAEANAKIYDWYFFWGIPLLIASLGAIYLPIGGVMCAWPRIRARRQTVDTGMSGPGG